MTKRSAKSGVKAAADRAAARSEGKPMPEAPAVPIDPAIVKASEIIASMGKGRPPTYKQEFAEQAKKLCALGATDQVLADFFEVTTTTIWRWRSEHEEFCKALIQGKKIADDLVERALYQRAVGYSYDSIKYHAYEGIVTQTPCVEHVPPDPGAAKLWLTNRRPKEWREKQDITVSASEQFSKLWRSLATGKLPKIETEGDDA